MVKYLAPLLVLISLCTTALAEKTPTLQIAMAESDPQMTGETAGDAWSTLNPKKLKLRSTAALITDRFGNEIYGKQVDEPRPIASITKLMTAMVILDAPIPGNERLTITKEDRDLLRLTGSRLKYGATLPRDQLLKIALMASDNRAANALARTFPAGREAFIQIMNEKARSLGMHDSRFADPSGLDAGNVASARDLVKMVRAAMSYPLIREATTTRAASFRPYKKLGPLKFGNTNRLLKNGAWKIDLSKTGYINEAGRCLVMHVEILDQPMVIVLLNSYGKLTPFGDSNRIRKWIEKGVQITLLNR